MSDGFLLSPQQKLFFSQGAVSSATQLAVQLAGSLDAGTLKSALLNVIERHEILRTRFEQIPGMIVPVQAVYESELDWQQSAVDQALTGKALEQKLIELRAGIDKDDRPDNLIFAMLFEASQVSTLVLTMHPLFADTLGLHRLVEELSMEYQQLSQNGAGCQLEEPLQLIDVASWLNELIESDDAIAFP